MAGRLAATLFACLALAAVAAGGASAATFEPPDGTVYAGGYTSSDLPDFSSFLATTEQPAVALYTYFMKYPSPFAYPFRLVRERPAELALTWQLFNTETGYDPDAVAGTTGRIARGEIDAYILDRAAEACAFGRPLMLRLNHEMNGNWFPWSIRGRDGVARPDNGYAEYIGLWRRVVILFRGGTRAQIDARLRAVDLPELSAPGGSFAPASNVAFVWNGSDGGSDDPHLYYPGDAYVDWVGVDVYDKSRSTFADQIARKGQSVYDRYSGPRSSGHKPFAIPEWGLVGEDDAAWVSGLFDWVEAHPKVKAHQLLQPQPRRRALAGAPPAVGRGLRRADRRRAVPAPPGRRPRVRSRDADPRPGPAHRAGAGPRPAGGRQRRPADRPGDPRGGPDGLRPRPRPPRRDRPLRRGAGALPARRPPGRRRRRRRPGVPARHGRPVPRPAPGPHRGDRRARQPLRRCRSR